MPKRESVLRQKFFMNPFAPEGNRHSVGAHTQRGFLLGGENGKSVCLSGLHDNPEPLYISVGKVLQPPFKGDETE